MALNLRLANPRNVASQSCGPPPPPDRDALLFGALGLLVAGRWSCLAAGACLRNCRACHARARPCCGPLELVHNLQGLQHCFSNQFASFAPVFGPASSNISAVADRCWADFGQFLEPTDSCPEFGQTWPALARRPGTGPKSTKLGPISPICWRSSTKIGPASARLQICRMTAALGLISARFGPYSTCGGAAAPAWSATPDREVVAEENRRLPSLRQENR